MTRDMSGRRLVTQFALTLVGVSFSALLLGAPPSFAQGAVGVLHEVRIVDTAEGQDVEFATTSQPGDVVPLQKESCTFAVELPNIVPGPEVTSQFFRSELIQNLTVRTAPGRAATEICVETAVSVRSRVALRPTGMTMRLVPVTTAPPSEARPASSLDAVPADAAAVETASPSAPPTGATEGSSARRERELNLALREERVARREMQLEMADLRRQLAEQIEANARLDQAATREEAQSDLIEPRIDRLAELLGVGASGVLPVERFDAALAELRSRIDRQAEGADEGRKVEGELDRLLAVIEAANDSLVMTNDAVNVRLGPSTEEVRVAFLPAGVLLRVEERRGPWSRVRSGGFEGWIFDELLEPARLQPLDEGIAMTGSRSERVRLAARAVERLDLERQLLLQAADQRAEQAEKEQSVAVASLEDRLAQVESDLALARAENERLTASIAEREREQTVLEQQISAAAPGRLEERVQGLAAWLPESTAETVRVTAATNLRVGPGTEEERVALLPPGFELVVLDRREDWVQVGYGALTGWMATAFTEPVLQGPEGAARLSPDLVLDRVERFLSVGANRQPADQDGGQTAAVLEPVDLIEGEPEPDQDPAASEASRPSDVLRGAADAVYQHFAAARQRDAEGFLSFYAEDFVPVVGSVVTWREDLTDQIERGLYAGSQVQNLTLRRVSDDLVEATFVLDGADPEVARRRRVDLGRVNGAWRILVETTPEAQGASN